jgi:hypothetical protein
MVRGIFLRYVVPFALRFQAPRKLQFKLVSQTRIHYRDSSTLSQGAVGEIHGGDRLPWLPSQDNFQPLQSLDWQIHVYGKFTGALHDLSTRWNVPIQSFYWDKNAQSAGLVRDAVYLVRPDGHIALAQPDQNAEQLEKYLSQWLLPSASAGN